MDTDNKNEQNNTDGKTSLFEIVDESEDTIEEANAADEVSEPVNDGAAADDTSDNKAASDDGTEKQEPDGGNPMTAVQTKLSQGAEEKKASAPSDKKQKKHEKEEEKPTSLFKEILSWIEVLVIAVVVALVCNNFIIANSTVPTGSMEDTIEQGDRVIGSRISYYIGDPERGDIAIFKFGWICNRCGEGMGEGTAPETCTSCGQKITHPKTLYYLKRTIGVPGDVIEIKAEGSVKASELQELPGVDGGSDAELVTAAVYVNGEKLDEPYLREPMLYTGDMKFEVPENCYFFLGDNRNYSMDARYWENSYISKDKVIAKVLFRYFPNPAWLDS